MNTVLAAAEHSREVESALLDRSQGFPADKQDNLGSPVDIPEHPVDTQDNLDHPADNPDNPLDSLPASSCSPRTRSGYR
jgi:hypothetical protein